VIFIKDRNLNSYLFLYYKYHFEMLDYSFNEFALICSLYFVCYFYLEENLKKKIDIEFINLRIVWKKINNPLRFLQINQT